MAPIRQHGLSMIEGMTRHEIRVNKITRRKNSLKGKEGPNKNSLLSKETSKERRLGDEAARGPIHVVDRSRPCNLCLVHP